METVFIRTKTGVISFTVPTTKEWKEKLSLTKVFLCKTGKINFDELSRYKKAKLNRKAKEILSLYYDKRLEDLSKALSEAEDLLIKWGKAKRNQNPLD